MGTCWMDGILGATAGEGFWTGMAAGAVVFFLLWCLIKLLLCSRSGCQSIRVADSEGGGFVITAAAVKSFVQWIVAEFPEVDLRIARLKTLRDGLSLEIVLNVVPGAELAVIRQQLRERLFKEIETKLGVVDQVKKIDIEVDGFDAREERIAKHNRGIKV